MLTGVAYVSTYQPSDSAVASDHGLQRLADDFLKTAHETPLQGDACRGATSLEALLLEGVNGDSSQWQRRKERLLPPGTEAELFLDNSKALYPIQSASGFKGTTSILSLDPLFTFLAPMAELSVADGQSRQVSSLVGISDAALLRAKGEAIKSSVTIAQGTGTKEYAAWTVSALLSQADAEERPGLNVTWELSNGIASLAETLSPSDVLPTAPAKAYTLSIESPSDDGQPPEPLPVGLRLTLSPPPSWELKDVVAEGWSWKWETSTVVLELIERGPSRPVKFHLKPPANPIHPYEVLHARLGNGSLGESSLVVTYPTSVERSLPRTVHPTVPYPLRPGARALFGVAFANGGEKTVVTQVDLEVPGGYDVWRNDGEGAELFAEADFLRPSDQDGTWTWLDARHVRWTGSRVVEGLGASSWTVGVLVTDDAGEATSIEPAYSDGPVGTLTFANGFGHVSTRWGAVPGVVRHDVPPASGPGEDDGYPWVPASSGGEGAAVEVETEHGVQLSSVEATLRGSGRYEVSAASGDLLRVQSSLANSTFSVHERKVPVGGLLRSDADFESLVNELGRAGVADTTLTMEMYAPPSRGCAPTATWTRASSSLPLAQARDVAVWDAEGLGVADLFLVADDAQAYRVDRVGSPLWSAPLGGKGLKLLPTAFGPADRRLYAATQEGGLVRLDPLTGAVLWSRAVTGDVATLESVTALAAQPAQGRVLVGTSLGSLLAFDAETGERAPAGPATMPAAQRVLQVETLASGEVLVAHGEGLRLLGPDLDVRAERAAEGVVGFAVAPERVLLATATAVHDLARADLSVTASMPSAREAALSAAGDATGDGVPDLVVALKDLGVVAYSGATGTAAWERRGDAWLAPVPSEVPFRAEDAWRLLGDPAPCTAPSATYQTAHEACAWDAGRDQSEPLLLRVGAARVYFAHVHHGNPYLDGLDHQGRLVAQAFLSQVPRVLAPGAWTLDEAVAVAGAEGSIYLYEGTRWETPALHARPTDFVGRFTFFTPVPGGGFFGSHLLVATLSWSEQGTTREARLFDWFEVVDPDGKPVLEPSYRVVLVVQDRGDPVER